MNHRRALGVVLAGALLLGCTATPQASNPPAASDSSDASGSSRPPVDPSTPEASAETDAAPSDGGAGEGVDRATGSGSVILDGVTYELEVGVCGWSVGRTRPLQADPGARKLFQLMAVQGHGTGMIAFELDWDGRTGVIGPAVFLADPTDPGAAFRYADERQPIDFVEIDGGHVRTLRPVTVLDSSNVVTAERHELEVDITCDTFGGSFATAVEIAAEITGLDPIVPDAGEVAVNGETTVVEVTSCTRLGDQLELEGESPDGSIYLSLLVSPGFNRLLFSVDGFVLSGASAVDVELDGDGVSTASAVTGEIVTRGPAEVTFRLPCA